ncbi:MAG TPA: PDZ domain-containing protein [Phycisphaerales bacterium]
MSCGKADRQSRGRHTAHAVGCALALVVGGAWAWAERADDREFAAAKVKELDSDSVRVRENAEDALRAWCRNKTDRVLSLIEPGASAEQRDRLLSLAREVFEASPRAAMGVSFGVGNVQFGNFEEEVFDGGIPIAGPVKGFDSENVLKPGDLLLSIDGVRVRTNAEARVQIISHDPDQVVRLEVERDAKVLQLPLRLGNWGNLNVANRGVTREISRPERDAAWRARLARTNPALLTLDTKPVLRPVPNAAAWNEGERLANDQRENVVRIPESGNLRLNPGMDQPRRVVQIGIDGNVQRLDLGEDGNPTVADLHSGGVPRGTVSETPSDADLRPQRSRSRVGNLNADAGDLRMLEIQRMGFEQQANILREQLRDRKLDPDTRRGLGLMLERIETDIAGLDAQIERRQRNRRP